MIIYLWMKKILTLVNGDECVGGREVHGLSLFHIPIDSEKNQDPKKPIKEVFYLYELNNFFLSELSFVPGINFLILRHIHKCRLYVNIFRFYLPEKEGRHGMVITRYLTKQKD